MAVIAAVAATWQQLDSEQLDVRLGGIYGLERIAARGAGSGTAAAQDRVQVFEILSAYVRTTSHRPPVGPAEATDLQVRQPDVHAAVAALARRTVLAGDPPLDLTGSLLPRPGSAGPGWPGPTCAGPTCAGPASSTPSWPGPAWCR